MKKKWLKYSIRFRSQIYLKNRCVFSMLETTERKGKKSISSFYDSQSTSNFIVSFQLSEIVGTVHSSHRSEMMSCLKSPSVPPPPTITWLKANYSAVPTTANPSLLPSFRIVALLYRWICSILKGFRF